MAYLILIIIFFVFLAQFIAKKKGLDPVYWAVMGGIFGPLAIPVILLIKSKKSNSEQI
ncbi:MAG: hypothetical protein HN349_15255 [Gammaproteobacteria bacterium]|nr:hypothetical protein [Gammaproteobacteria bacterium]MBT6457231.1 hypothetical protein [Gammaproteobacteria bacterium]MBT7046970.1 hypothetical protein [Gammaproteobacteria bacterium]